MSTRPLKCYQVYLSPDLSTDVKEPEKKWAMFNANFPYHFLWPVLNIRHESDHSGDFAEYVTNAKPERKRSGSGKSR